MISIPGAASKSNIKNEDEEKNTSDKVQALEEKKEFYHSLIKKQNNISTLQK